MHPSTFGKSTGCLNMALPYRCSSTEYLGNKEERKNKRKKKKNTIKKNPLEEIKLRIHLKV